MCSQALDIVRGPVGSFTENLNVRVIPGSGAKTPIVPARFGSTGCSACVSATQGEVDLRVLVDGNMYAASAFTLAFHIDISVYCICGEGVAMATDTVDRRRCPSSEV